MNIYIFRLKLIKGNFTESAETIMSIGQNIYEDVWKIVLGDDLAFYFALSMLTKPKQGAVRNIHMVNIFLIYKLFEDFPNYLELLANYSKCRFE